MVNSAKTGNSTFNSLNFGDIQKGMNIVSGLSQQNGSSAMNRLQGIMGIIRSIMTFV